MSALITRLIFQRNVRGEGMALGRGPRWAALAYLLPVVYATARTAWCGSPDLAGSISSLQDRRRDVLRPRHRSRACYRRLVRSWDGGASSFRRSRETMSFGRTAIVSGAIWAAWHVPLIVFADYNGGTPTWYSVLCFAIMVVAIGVPVRVAAPALAEACGRRRSCTRRTTVRAGHSSIA